MAGAPAGWRPYSVVEQRRQLPRVHDAVVAVAVVHERVHLARLLGERAHARRPLAQLVLGVEVAEALGRRRRLLLPEVGRAAVEAHHGDLARRGDHRRRARGEPLGLVDAHVGEAEALEDVERAALVAGVHPAAAAELDGDPEPGQLPGDRLEVGHVLPVLAEPVRELEEHHSQLAVLTQGRQRAPVQLPDGLLQVGGQVA